MTGGLTSNSTILDHSVKNSSDYDVSIREKTATGMSGEKMFFELAIEDLSKRPTFPGRSNDATNGVDGWVDFARGVPETRAGHSGYRRIQS